MGDFLRIEGLSKRFGGVVATDSLNLSIPTGQVTGIIGPNGAGKSTLIGLLGGALKPSAGRIVMAGQDITDLPAPARAKLGVGRTYQIPRPFLDMTVTENLEVAQFAIDPFQSGRSATEERRDILHKTGLASVAHLTARTLPLLRRKRLEVARALALKPKLLLLDEVGAGLVDQEISELIGLIRSLADGERTIIIIEHVIRVVRECCSHCVVINFGKKFAEGPTEQVLASDDVASVYLGTGHGGGGRVAPSGTPAPEKSEPPLLELKGVYAGYGQAKVLHDLNLTVRKGEVVAILGANGAGKTTLAHVVSGSVRPTAGHVIVGGRDMVGRPPHEITAAGIAHCMEGRRIFPSLSVEENLIMAARGVPVREQQQRLDRVYTLFGVLKDRRQSPGTSMSGGQQQMLAIGRALMSAPRLVIFDEISLGLAPIMMDHVYEALARLKAEGLTMLIVEQDVDRALALAHTAHVLDKGRIDLSGTAESVRTDARLKHLYFGTT
ncbi:ABC-type branched-chain amino acid transport system, ATPase component [Pseudoxanthobacter soli DSM 19599]|uniref:ABC-type branched-chain amino acid transport system, ATPase component n=1 Tax=Pseudoxanthobacter soli DSM 19599 TaxID=1123029 RepID=A0A1M7ZRX5_9HYPH|nr:ATP-binding cassette domain-containing protein [Pseudoxanthobacter soli]SHO67664.1 ABC-type branched-chain amino acid transport system, ATPase component [Pseudoxanthobacter soli DSM 19599]